MYNATQTFAIVIEFRECNFYFLSNYYYVYMKSMLDTQQQDKYNQQMAMHSSQKWHTFSLLNNEGFFFIRKVSLRIFMIGCRPINVFTKPLITLFC